MFGFFGKKEEPYVSILAGTEDESDDFAGGELLVSAVSDVGFVRHGNEDSFYADGFGIKPEENCLLSRTVGGHERYIFAVCDGMGGEAYGELASDIAVTSLGKRSDVIRCVSLKGLHSAVNDYADAANAGICRMAEQKKCGRSGSTLAMACIDNGTVYAFNLGDSRVYYFRGGDLTRLSQDHTLAAQKLRDGELTEEIRSSSDAHKLITFLGVDDDSVGLTVYASEPVELGDGKVLICSDGLTDMCSDAEIAKVLAERHVNYAEALAEKALSKGGWDNVTCIVISKA
ncbi:MAG: protein phosphatase 2C domain-containing protein [Ruminococcus sp.]|nr:protein phosphatase 2C domain-containing protein [Ruminococcus sp.]